MQLKPIIAGVMSGLAFYAGAFTVGGDNGVAFH